MTGRAALALLLLAACTGPRVAGYEVTQPVSQPVKVVSLEIDPSPPYIIGADRIAEILRALSPGLARYGISVVPRGTGGAPALIGQVEAYDPGTDPAPFKMSHSGTFRARWHLVGDQGVTLGSCKTDAQSRNDVVYADFGSAMEDTGYRLGQFLHGN